VRERSANLTVKPVSQDLSKIKSRKSSIQKWLTLACLAVTLGGLLLLGDMLDQLPLPAVAADGPVLRGWRRRVVESLAVLPPELGGPGQPGFYPPPGVYERTLRVELRPDDRRATIIYTTDGSVPSPDHGTVYRQALRLDARHPGVTVIRAVQVLHGVPGPEITAVYAVGLDSRLPVLSLVAAPDDLWGAEAGILVNPSYQGREWERSIQMTLFEVAKGTASSGGFTIPAGVRLHRRPAPLAMDKQSLRLYFRGDYGAARLEYPLFPEHPDQPDLDQTYNHLLLQAGDRNGWWTLFRDELVAETARALHLPTAQARIVHLFINGRSWGLYRLAERVNRFFLEDNFGYRGVDVVQEGSTREGSADDWSALVEWAMTYDMAEPGAYVYVTERMDVANFTDYAVLQLYFGFSADDLYAVRDRGGRWHFVYGGGGAHFAQRPGDSLAALAMEDTDFALLLRSLMDNAAFRRGLQARVVTLLNTTLAPEVMAERVAALEATLTADARYEEARWHASTAWADNVAQLRGFVAARPTALRAALGELWGLSAPVTLRVQVEPPEGGEVYVGGLPLPGEGDFFAGTEVELMVVPRPGFTFAGWHSVPEEAGGTCSIERRRRPELPDPPTIGDATLRWPVEGPCRLDVHIRPIEADEPGPYPNDVIINEFWINDNGTRYRSLGGRPLTGDWIELLVLRPNVVDLRGWRLTDNDTKTSTDEGSIIFPNLDAFAAVPRGTVILIIASENLENAAYFPNDDLDHSDGRMILYVGNGNLDIVTDPGFGLGTRNDNLVLLAPGPLHEVGIDFVAEGTTVTPYSFGVLADGVVFDNPFRRLGRDDGAVFTGGGSNDDGARDWIVDPPACQSGDAVCLDQVNILTPGALNPGQRWALWWTRVLGTE
jgi:hypothetical protein